jgi:hypothetical protein
MTDNELINILGKYQEKEMEIERIYNIKKEELEKDYKNQKKNNRDQLLNSLFEKEEKVNNRMKGLKKDLDGLKKDIEGIIKDLKEIIQIRKILSENEEKKGIQEIEDMPNESQVTLKHKHIHFREEDDSDDSQIEENNGMEQSKKEESEESEEIENIDEEPKKNKLMKKEKNYPMKGRKRIRPPFDNEN